jgi:hypothetical protein
MEKRQPARLMICVIAVVIMTTLMDGRVCLMPQSDRPLVQRIMSLDVKVCDNRIRKLNVFRFGWWPRLCVNFHSGPTWRPESQILCQSCWSSSPTSQLSQSCRPSDLTGSWFLVFVLSFLFFRLKIDESIRVEPSIHVPAAGVVACAVVGPLRMLLCVCVAAQGRCFWS